MVARCGAVHFAAIREFLRQCWCHVLEAVVVFSREDHGGRGKRSGFVDGLDGFEDHQSGIVDQNVDAAEYVDCPLDQRVPGLAAAQQFVRGRGRAAYLDDVERDAVRRGAVAAGYRGSTPAS